MTDDALLKITDAHGGIQGLWYAHVPIIADVELQCKLHSTHFVGVAAEAAPPDLWRKIPS